VFSKFRLRGAGDGAAVTWGGYRTAVRLATWRVSKVQKTLSVSPAGVPSLGEPVWVLNGTLAGAPDYFVAKQSALLLAIPRPGGFWTWPVQGALRIENNVVIATLGPPLQG
jgi:hypothetical protein